MLNEQVLIETLTVIEFPLLNTINKKPLIIGLRLYNVLHMSMSL